MRLAKPCGVASLWRAVLCAVFWAVCLVVLTIGQASQAIAYTYLIDVTAGPLVNGQRYSLALLFHDGFWNDPMRPVVLDEKGMIVALGPQGSAGAIRCDPVTPPCVVYLTGSTVRAVRVDPSTFGPPRKPDFFPDSEAAAYGFSAHVMMPADYWHASISAFYEHTYKHTDPDDQEATGWQTLFFFAMLTWFNVRPLRPKSPWWPPWWHVTIRAVVGCLSVVFMGLVVSAWTLLDWAPVVAGLAAGCLLAFGTETWRRRRESLARAIRSDGN
jgi:hypothetical protein